MTVSETLADFGVVVSAAGPVRAWAVFFPPATGDGGQQRNEAAELGAFGISSLLYVPPYRRAEQFPGGILNPEGERRRWTRAQSEVGEILRAIDRSSRGVPVAFVGKNQGGSVAASTAPPGLAALVVSGSVPQLSAFALTAPHPSARQARSLASLAQLELYRESLRRFDLVHTLPERSVPTLLQFGSRDEWILPRQLAALHRAVAGRTEVEWENGDDDHPMDSLVSRAGRRDFLRRVLLGGAAFSPGAGPSLV